MKYMPAFAGVVILACSGYVHGLVTDRWSRSNEVGAAVGRLDRVPMTVGLWVGTPTTLDPKVLEVGGIAGYINRRYENLKTGQVVAVLIVCGRPGPISVHTPDVCYSSAGFELVAGQSLHRVRPGDEFTRGDLARVGAAVPESLRIFWAWKATGGWRVPGDPRLAYGGVPFLYKMYVLRGTASPAEGIEGDACLELMKELLPEIDKALPSGDKGAQGDPRPVANR